MTYDTIILGAGASGLMAAAKLKHKNILLIEGNAKAGVKLKISGGGRCNITNEFVTADNYLGEKNLVSEVLKGFDQVQVMDYFHRYGLQTVQEKNHQYFCKHSSQDLIDILLTDQIFISKCAIKRSVSSDKIEQSICERLETSRESCPEELKRSILRKST